MQDPHRAAFAAVPYLAGDHSAPQLPDVQAPQVLHAQLEEHILGDDPRAGQDFEHALDLFRREP